MREGRGEMDEMGMEGVMVEEVEVAKVAKKVSCLGLAEVRG